MAEPVSMLAGARHDIDIFLGADTVASGPLHFEGVSAFQCAPGFISFVDSADLEHSWAGMFVASI